MLSDETVSSVKSMYSTLERLELLHFSREAPAGDKLKDALEIPIRNDPMGEQVIGLIPLNGGTDASDALEVYFKKTGLFDDAPSFAGPYPLNWSPPETRDPRGPAQPAISVYDLILRTPAPPLKTPFEVELPGVPLPKSPWEIPISVGEPSVRGVMLGALGGTIPQGNPLRG